MASTGGPQGHLNQRKRTSFSGYPSNASIFRDKAKAGQRGSTPDSEALASSDDEQEHQYRLHSIANLQASRSVRRASWLAEAHQVPQRKGSLGGGGAFSPNASHPTTPSGEQISWSAAASTSSASASATGRAHSSSNSIPWVSAIWSSDAQKGPPSRLTEVLPSPTTLVPPASAGSLVEDPLLSPTYSRENNNDSAIPFAIPLQPTLKTYRSQSYSVGQIDPESASPIPNIQLGHAFNNRSRSGVSYSGLQHRRSRPSMLGDPSYDASLLGQLREVDDDDESSTGSEAGVQLYSQARTIDQLARENAMLRQAAAEQIESVRGQNRANATVSRANIPRRVGQTTSRVHDSVKEEGDHGVTEQSGIRVGHSYSNEALRARRSSEYAFNPISQHTMTGIPENRNLESFKKNHWQSSLGFGGIVETPQSRRHSFAEVPTRQTSISSSGEFKNGPTAEQGPNPNAGQSGHMGHQEGLARPSQGDGSEYNRFRFRQSVEEMQLELEHLRDRDFAASYFSGIESSLQHEDIHGTSRSPATSYHSFSTHPYGRPQHLGPNQLRANQPLYVVTFKACRADVFYVAEGTGLQVNPGDLVIVEADRGTDLGTVAHENCSWARARELKDKCTEEHFRWLMMFSRQGQTGAVSGHNFAGQQVQPNNSHPSSLANLEASTGLSIVQEPLNAELKPKMIKRLAQAGEIQTLREKEGNEAKAKRVCQQKVVEHRLNMEILDAEFQVDWKKLTFYYFADAYINFNPLVTDLFKIYKTRIWMSAINPASFGTPATILQPPSGPGPGAFLPETSPGSDGRQYRATPNLSAANGPQTGYRGTGRAWDPNREAPNLTQMSMANAFPQQFQTADYGIRPMDQYPVEYPHGGQQIIGLQPRYNPALYSLSNLQNPLYPPPIESRDEVAATSNAVGAGWNHAFQGLSLGS
ncbi:MAG: hypothetical protein Q9218_000968 [Villophora microphyllina]